MVNSNFDFLIIGGGIVGLSTAVQIQQSGKKVLVLEKEKTPGNHQSGRNSGVIHSGIYYKPNSFKSQLSIRGRELLVEFLRIKNIPFRLEGKVVVAITVDRLGNVINAIPGIKGSTTLNKQLLQRAKTAALKTKFNPKKTAPNNEQGKIVYHFSLN